MRDYRTVELTPALDKATGSIGEAAGHIGKVLVRSRTILWVCIGGAAQLIVVSAVWSWLPSFLNRTYDIAPAQAGVRAAVVVLAGAIGSVVCGAVVDRVGTSRPRAKFAALSLLCIATLIVLMLAFGTRLFGLSLHCWAAICTHHTRRLHNDLHSRSHSRNRHRCHPSGSSRNRMFPAGPIPEFVWALLWALSWPAYFQTPGGSSWH